MLQYYQGTVAQIVGTTQTKLDKAWQKLSFIFKYNIDKWITYTTMLLVQLVDPGERDTHIFYNVYERMLCKQCKHFNSEIVVYKLFQQNLQTFYASALLVNAHE